MATTMVTDRPNVACKITPDAPCRLCGGTSGSGRDNAHNLCLLRAERGLPTPCLGIKCEACGGGGTRADLPGWPRCEVCGGRGYVEGMSTDAGQPGVEPGQDTAAARRLAAEVERRAEWPEGEDRDGGAWAGVDPAELQRLVKSHAALANELDATRTELAQHQSQARYWEASAKDYLDRAQDAEAKGDGLAPLLEAIDLWYERAADGDRDMIADAEDLYRAVRDWHKSRSRAEAATAPVIADSADLERELTRVAHLATAPVTNPMTPQGWGLIEIAGGMCRCARCDGDAVQRDEWALFVHGAGCRVVSVERFYCLHCGSEGCGGDCDEAEGAYLSRAVRA